MARKYLDDDPFSVLRFSPAPVFGDLNEQDTPHDDIFDGAIGGLQRRVAETGLRGLLDRHMCNRESAVDYFVSNTRQTRQSPESRPIAKALIVEKV